MLVFRDRSLSKRSALYRGNISFTSQSRDMRGNQIIFHLKSTLQGGSLCSNMKDLGERETINWIEGVPPPWTEFASELYLPTDRCLSAKIGQIFADIGVSRNQLGGSPTAVISIFYTGAATFSFKQLLNCTDEAEWTPFQPNCFSENLVAPGIEPGPVDLYSGTLTSRPQRRSTFYYIVKVKLSHNRPWRPIGLRNFKDPTLSR
jgi:hypothetical protein